MNAVIKSIMPGSPASATKISPGDVLRKINGKTIEDVLDYKFGSYDSRLMLELRGADGKMKLVRVNKPEGADVGLEFETFLMDKQRSCANKCIFCFIDQLPEGMRETLYYKDDDVRLSFLQGNYVTLTNLSQRDIERIIKMRISPINVSVHTLDPELRAYMLGTKRGAAGIDALTTLAGSGIGLNCQIVCCPGVNDGERLDSTMRGLFKLGATVRSVSVVPVGLTKHRQGLTPLEPFDRELAVKTIKQVEGFARRCLREAGRRLFFCADELYILAGAALPPYENYEDYPQLENGVGMMRLFITEFEDALNEYGVRNGRGAADKWTGSQRRYAHRGGGAPGAAGFATGAPRAVKTGSEDIAFSVATGVAAGEYLTKLLKTAAEVYGNIKGMIYTVKNGFFGESVNVSGLVTGGDIIAALRGKKLGERLLIPKNMLRRGEDVFLDDVTVAGLSEALGVPVRVVRQDGADLLHAFLGG